ncbi:hypothetical protein Isop_0560 [Isosphaera pallida ATCC 43644]|uniref:Uncharacterized protein n=1 Tax=Isosphaera pallida (strain ATCC 43644 / DSM 9630 / IS1B) TaxID=575540 RepID=E8R035_ISOPI|nr:hypothetical protein [Isosphaera pallida]ADV61153.1 hypothetical protein Isop_0560 [Isosphaera pallida ATCC 43644]
MTDRLVTPSAVPRFSPFPALIDRGNAVDQAISDKRRELEELRNRAAALERELAENPPAWQATGYYFYYHASTGFLLGIFGSITSLLTSMLSSIAVGKNALELIRIYMTFPLGERALELTNPETQLYTVPDSLILIFGCCLYVAMGMLMGIPVYLFITWVAPKGNLVLRSVLGVLAALAIWGINFYGVLSWLQPTLFGGNWILDQSLLPWWVAAANHAVYGLTIGLMSRLGEYRPYVPPGMASPSTVS